MACLRSGRTSASISVMPSLPATASRRGAIVAGQHDDADALGAQRGERVRRRLLDRIGDGDDAGELAIDRDEHRGGAVAPQFLGARSSAAVAMPRSPSNAALPTTTRMPPILPMTPLPVTRFEIGDVLQREAAFFRGGDDGGGEGMLARALEARGAATASSPRRILSVTVTATTRGLPSVSVPVLSTTSVSIALEPLQRLGILDQHAGRRAFADADHDRHRRRKAERAGTGDDQHRHRGDQRIGESRRRVPRSATRRRRWPRRSDHGGHEPGRDIIGEALDRRAAALRLGDHLHDARQHGLGADLLGTHHE